MDLYTHADHITLAGDWHGYTAQAVKVIDHAIRSESEIIIQLGDFGIWNGDESFLNKVSRILVRNNKRLFFVDGNHENFTRLYAYPIDPLTGLRPIREAIFHLPRGYRFTINDVRFLALGGAYSVDRQWRKLNKSYWLEETVTAQDIDTALAPEDPTTDVLLMHDSPYPASNPITDNPVHQAPGLSMFGQTAIQASNAHRALLSPVFHQTQPHYLFHGHYHKYWTAGHRHPSGRFTKILALNEGSAPLHEHAYDLDLDKIKDED